MMMPWLLKHEGYPPAVVVAVVLHAILLYVIFEREMSPDEFIRIEPPAMVIATVQENPQQVKRLENQEARRQQQRREEQQRREQQRVQEEQRVARETAQREEAERQQRVAEQRKQEQAEQARKAEEQRKLNEAQALAERQQREQLEREQIAQERAAREEAERQAAAAAATAQALTEEQQLVAQYSELMKRAISRQWSRPTSARNGMLAVLEIRVVPTGEVISSRVIQSSGDAAYDRSIQVAIEKVDNFPELQDVPTNIFNRYFRTVTIGFRSEDLLR